MLSLGAAGHKTVSSALVRRIQRHLMRAGLGRAEFCARTGVRDDELDSPTARIGMQRYARVQMLLRQSLQSGAVLARPTMETLLDDLPALAGLWCNCPSLASALQHYAGYRSLLGEPDALSLHVVDDALELRYLPEPNPAGQAIGADSAVGNFALISAIVEHYRAGAPDEASLQADVVLHGVPRAALANIEATLGRPCRVDSQVLVHRLVLGGPGLRAASQGFNALLYAHARRRLDDELRALHALPPLAARVCAALEAVWGDAGAPAGPGGLLARVAERLHMSRWTLRRHLEAQGHDFQSLLAELRARQAQALLGEDRLSLADISQRLGFDSQSSFSRFFRARFDETPARVRDRLRARGGGAPPGRFSA